MEQFINGITLSEVSFKLLFLVLFWIQIKRIQALEKRNDEIVEKFIESGKCKCGQHEG